MLIDVPIFKLDTWDSSIFKKAQFFYLVLLSTVLGACATTQKGKVFEYSLIGGAIGAVYGNARPEFKQENANLYGSQGAFLGAILASLSDERDQKIKDLEAKVKFFDETTSSTQRGILTELPEEFRPLLESKSYEIYQINRWTRKGPRYLVKESEVIEFKN